MLPLFVLTALVGAGLIVNRNESADAEEAPEPETNTCRPGKDGQMPVPYRPPRTKKSPTWDDLRAQREQRLAPRDSEALDHRGERMTSPVGPFGDGPLAHFTESQVGSISQAPAQLARAGAGIDPAHHAAGTHVKRELATPGPPQANRLVAAPTAGIDAERSRYNVPFTQTGVAPFRAEREKPVAETSETLRRAARPRDVDSLRAGCNPKDVKGGRFTAAPFSYNIPGEVGQFTTQRRSGGSAAVPGDANGHFGTGAAAVRRRASAGEFLVPETHRGGDAGTMGPAARALGFQSAPAGETRDTSPHLTSTRHAGFLAGGSRGRDRGSEVSMYRDDLGDATSGFRISGSARLGAPHAAPMGTRSPLRNASSSVSRKEVLTPTARHFGELQIASNPPKQTIYEPEALRTTMRETSIHDTHEGMLRGVGAPRGDLRSPEAHARSTVRETVGSVQGSAGDGRLDGTVTLTKPPVYDPNDVFDTTVKETTEVNAHMGNIGAYQRSAGPIDQPEADMTQRAYDADRDRSQYFGNATRESANAYALHTDRTTVTWDGPPTTNRDLSACVDYKGTAGAKIKAFPSDDQAYTRVIGDAKESILRRRSPAGRKEVLSPGTDGLGRTTWDRDPCMDKTSSRLVFQNQHQWQQAKQPDTREDTRGGRLVFESAPDPTILRQLGSNQYAIKNKGVV